jgi:hypothetical protein
VAIEGDLALALHNEPVLRAASVALIAQPFARRHRDRLDLETAAFRENVISAPRPLLAVHPRTIAPDLLQSST